MKTMQDDKITVESITEKDSNSIEKIEPTRGEDVKTPGSFYADTDQQCAYYILHCLPYIKICTKIPTARQLLQAKGWLSNIIQNDPDMATNEFLIIKLITLCSTFYDLTKKEFVNITFDTIVSALEFQTMVGDLELFFRYIKEFRIDVALGKVFK